MPPPIVDWTTRAIAQAHQQGFDAEYPELFVRATRAAARIVSDPHQAEDIAAETLARTLASWSKVHGYATPFVIRVATNLALDELRRRGRRLEPVPEATTPHDELVSRLALVAALGRLSARQRQVLVLRFVVGLDEREVADALRISAGSVKVHAQRGLASLRRRYGVVPEEATDAAAATA
jgi:RNA polymerase sigma factor (sigma-70 family)